LPLIQQSQSGLRPYKNLFSNKRSWEIQGVYLLTNSYRQYIITFIADLCLIHEYLIISSPPLSDNKKKQQLILIRDNNLPMQISHEGICW